MKNSIIEVNPENLRLLREASGLSGEEVVRRAQKYHKAITYQALKSWEDGSASPDLDSIEALSRVYGVTVNSFFMTPSALADAIARWRDWPLQAWLQQRSSGI